jgi:hypothetical protein
MIDDTGAPIFGGNAAEEPLVLAQLGGGQANPATAAANAAINPNTDPLSDRTVTINGTPYTEREVLVLARAAQAGDPAAEPFLDASRDILRSFGFRTGALGVEGTVTAIADPARRMELVRGDSNTEITQLQRSADVALETASTELRERHGVFTEGRVTRTMPDGTTRTIDIGYTGNVAQGAAGVGVSRAEALAKIDWNVYRTALDAGFATNGLQSMTISGAWRPYAGLATTVGPIQAPGANQPHVRGFGLDISALNSNIAILNTQVGAAQPSLVEQFSFNLQRAGASQVIQPWMTYGTNLPAVSPPRVAMGNGFSENRLRPGIEWDHRHHLHISWRP